MTLILTAVCKDGIAICADKRRTVKTAHSTTYHDDLDKIYCFAEVDVIVFNHGINRLCQKDCRSYCSDFESTCWSQKLSFEELVDNFRSFIEPHIAKELLANKFDDAVGFVFCAAVDKGAPVVRELFWKKSSPIEDKTRRGLVRTGHAARYLDRYLTDHADVNTVEYWKKLTTSEAISELKRLYEEAIKRRDDECGQEFSDTFDTHELRN